MKDHQCAREWPAVWSALRAPPTERSVVYSCDTHARCGGLGDQLAGIVSIAAYALATNRTVRFYSSRLASMFDGLHLSAPPESSSADFGCGFIHSCSGLEREHPQNTVIIRDTNRAWLCSWVAESASKGPAAWLQQQLTTRFQLHATSNLYAAAGCMLRALIRPVPSVMRQASALLRPAPRWIGVHYRTGQFRRRRRLAELSQHGTAAKKEKVPPCARPGWTGAPCRIFADAHDHKMIFEAAKCAKSAAHHDKLEPANSGIVVLSDSQQAARAVAAKARSLANWTLVMASPMGDACFTDTGTGNQSTLDDCSFRVAVEWTLLASVDAVVSHAGMGPRGPSYVPYLSSAFSRTAQWYGHGPKRPTAFVARSGEVDACRWPVDDVRVSHISMGNWVC